VLEMKLLEEDVGREQMLVEERGWVLSLYLAVFP